MRLSEAIRLGIGAVEQTWESQFEFDDEGNVCKACAMGTARIAMGENPLGNQGYHSLKKSCLKFWPWVTEKMVSCPVCGEAAEAVIIIYSHIGGFSSDCGYWSRERIADWVSTIEPQDEQPSPSTEDKEAVCLQQ